jgi:hypothetical protein
MELLQWKMGNGLNVATVVYFISNTVELKQCRYFIKVTCPPLPLAQDHRVLEITLGNICFFRGGCSYPLMNFSEDCLWHPVINFSKGCQYLLTPSTIFIKFKPRSNAGWSPYWVLSINNTFNMSQSRKTVSLIKKYYLL